MKIYKNKNRFIILLCLALFYTGSLKAQIENFVTDGFTSYYFDPQNIGISTPQVTDFIRYGNIDVNHYNGLLNMEIELDGYKDNDFDLPMSIKYVSAGFIPSKRPSMVGHNWFLNFGGVITRTVKGSADDVKGKYVNDKREYLKDGLLVAIRNNTFKKYSQQDLLDFNVDKVPGSSKNKIPYYWGDFNYDLEPDIFNFSFGKHSGRFIIGNDGNIASLSGEGYKIDISQLSIQEYSTDATPISSTIKITTPDGYIYEFGGDNTYLEYFIPNNPEKLVIRPRHITSWHLKSIQAPNNRTVSFKYISKQLAAYYNYFLYSHVEEISRNSDAGCPYLSPYNYLEEKQIEVKDNIYTPILQSVTVDSAEIHFDIKTDKSFFKEDDYCIFLNNIKHYYNSVLTKNTDFQYLREGKYIFLNKLSKNKQVYTFSYNLTQGLPHPLTTSLDHWGFWNGGNNTVIENVEDYCSNLNENKNTVSGYHDVALLTLVKYPTGGISTISYEANTYNRYIKKNVEKNKQLDLIDTDGNVLCGGARVYQIKNYDPYSGKTYQIRTFKYENNEAGKGSGIIGSIPKYKAFESITHLLYFSTIPSKPGESSIPCANMRQRVYTDISANSLGFNENLPEYHIGYSDVIEESNDGSYIHYKYTSHADIPNSIEGTNYFASRIPFKAIASAETSSTDLEIIEKSKLYVTNDLSHFRGKLTSKITYNSSKKKVQEETYTYNSRIAKNKYQVSLMSVSRGRAAYKIYSTPCLVQKKEIIDSNNNIQTETYVYNNNSIVSEEKMINSDGRSITTNYKYPSDYTYSTLGKGEQKLIDKNILNKPLQIAKSMQKDAQSPMVKEVFSLLFEYKVENNLPVLSKIKKKDYDKNEFYITEEYAKYDVYGNPLYIVKSESDKYVYLWSYGGLYPVAEIKNATYSEVETVANAIGLNLTTLLKSNTPDMAKVNLLRDRLSKSLVTTYTYKPLVGILSITDPSAKTTYYDYNWNNQLGEISIKNGGNKEILNLYKYNYVNF